MTPKEEEEVDPTKQGLKQQEDEQINPVILQLKFLSEIKRGIENVMAQNDSMIEEGIIDPMPKAVTTSPMVVTPPMRKSWFGVKITNDGPESVWVILNTEKNSSPQEIMVGETWGVQFKTAVIKDLYLYTTTGTANIRIRGER